VHTAARHPSFFGTGGRSTSFVGTAVMLTLVIGLLNFPSMGFSGAEIPHAHSLFMLADHHHDSDGEIDFTQHDDTHDAAEMPGATNSATSGPVVHDATPEFVEGGPVGLFLTSLIVLARKVLMTPVALQENLPARGQFLTPEPPPPRRAR
jgi:hypothetical protein